MSTTISLLHQMIRKLSGRAALDQEDEDAILALPHVIRSHHPATYVIREGEPPPKHCAFIRSGFAIRQKITAQGARQIVSLHLAGDFIDLENLFLSIFDHNVQALTELEVVGVERRALEELVLARPNIARQPAPNEAMSTYGNSRNQPNTGKSSAATTSAPPLAIAWYLVVAPSLSETRRAIKRNKPPLPRTATPMTPE